jgi:hypothetical protein
MRRNCKERYPRIFFPFFKITFSTTKKNHLEDKESNGRRPEQRFLVLVNSYFPDMRSIGSFDAKLKATLS